MIDISKYEINLGKIFSLKEEERKIILDLIHDYRQLSFDAHSFTTSSKFLELLGNTLINNEYLVTVRERKLNEVLK